MRLVPLNHLTSHCRFILALTVLVDSLKILSLQVVIASSYRDMNVMVITTPLLYGELTTY